jgi:hypothetical protein
MIQLPLLLIFFALQKAKEIENARKIPDPVKEKGNIGGS